MKKIKFELFKFTDDCIYKFTKNKRRNKTKIVRRFPKRFDCQSIENWDKINTIKLITTRFTGSLVA